MNFVGVGIYPTSKAGDKSPAYENWVSNGCRHYVLNTKGTAQPFPIHFLGLPNLLDGLILLQVWEFIPPRKQGINSPAYEGKN